MVLGRVVRAAGGDWLRTIPHSHDGSAHFWVQVAAGSTPRESPCVHLPCPHLRHVCSLHGAVATSIFMRTCRTLLCACRLEKVLSPSCVIVQTILRKVESSVRWIPNQPRQASSLCYCYHCCGLNDTNIAPYNPGALATGTNTAGALVL